MRTPVPARATAMDMERMYNGMYAQWQMGMGVRDKLGDTACSGERGARTEVPSKWLLQKPIGVRESSGGGEASIVIWDNGSKSPVLGTKIGSGCDHAEGESGDDGDVAATRVG